MKDYPQTATPFEAYRWTKFVRVLDWQDPDGVYRDFAGLTVFGQIRQAPNADDVVAAIECAIIPHPDGHGDTHAVEIGLSADVLANILPGRYVYSVLLIPAAGTAGTELFIAGPFIVTANPTDPTEAP